LFVTVTESGIDVGGTELPLLSGAMHYWRVERARWAACLDAIVDMGFPIVETYAPWSVHEIGEGRFDFGKDDPRKDLGAFLDLAAEKGLRAIVRPGPHINAELTYFGYPERLLRDESILARSARGAKVLLPVPPRMFPVPSYACERFFDEVGRWYEAMADVVAPRLAPKGPVVLVQVDNEAALFFRDALFEQDYHPDAIAAFRAFLRTRHGSDAALQEAWHDPRVDLESVEPPRSRPRPLTREHLGRLYDWAEFQEELPRAAIERLERLLDERGLGTVPTSHNLPPGQWAIPMSIPALERVLDVVGIDLYSPRTDHRTLKQRILLLAGSARLPYSPELGSGAPPWYPQLEPEDARFLTMASVAYGLRGYNLYMAIDRDRWVGAPVDVGGRRRPMADFYTQFHAAAFGRHAIHRRRRKLGALVVVPRAYMRLSRVTHAWGPASPSVLEQLGLGPEVSCLEDELGFARPVQIGWVEALRALCDGLDRAGIAYGFLDGDAELDHFLTAPILCVPAVEFLPEPLVEKLSQAAGRGAAVVLGPDRPALDPLGRPLPHGLEFARIVDTADRAVLEAQLATLGRERGALSSTRTTTPDVDVTVLEQPGAPAVVFVIRRAGDETVARIERPAGAAALVDALTGEHVDPSALILGPFQVRMLGEVEAGDVR